MITSPIYAGLAVSISELKKNPSGVMKEAGSRVVAVLNHNKPQSYLVPAALFERLELAKQLKDIKLRAIVTSRMNSKRRPVKMELDDL